jgi:hypothetical protein
METELTKAQHYRDQAAKMRGLADKEENPAARQALISLAEMYAKLCDQQVSRSLSPAR